jgi:hypothetical protein
MREPLPSVIEAIPALKEPPHIGNHAERIDPVQLMRAGCLYVGAPGITANEAKTAVDVSKRFG